MSAQAKNSKLSAMKRWIVKHPFYTVILVVLVAGTLLPIIIMGWLLRHYSVNVPFWDQWEYVPMVYAVHHGTLTVHDLWRQHNEHRILFPRVVTLISALLTNYNVRYEILLNFLTASATFSLLLVMLKRTFGLLSKPMVALAFVFAWIVYSPLQWINWIWGFQLAFFMGVLFSALTVFLVSKTDSKRYQWLFWMSIATATIATYSLGNGIVVWGVGLGLLWLQRANRKKLWAWVVSAVLVAATYLHHFHRLTDSLPLHKIFEERLKVGKYLLSYLGHNLALTPPGARLTGAVLLVILMAAIVVLVRRKQWRPMLPWFGLIGYVLGTALLAAVSRLNFGIDHSMVDSYTTISLLFILGVLVVATYTGRLLLADATLKQLRRYSVGFVLIGLMAYTMTASFVGNYFSGWMQLADQGKDMAKIERCVYSATSPNDNCLLFAYPYKNVAWQDIQLLKALHWGRFAGTTKATACSQQSPMAHSASDVLFMLETHSTVKAL